MDQAVSMAENASYTLDLPVCLQIYNQRYGLHFDHHIVTKRGVTSFLVSDVSPNVTCHHPNLNMRRVTSGAGNAFPSGTPEFTPSFKGVRAVQSLDSCVVFCRPCFAIVILFDLLIVYP